MPISRSGSLARPVQFFKESEAKVSVDLTRQAVQYAPEYASTANSIRKGERRVDEYYDRFAPTIKTPRRRPPSPVRHAVLGVGRRPQ